MKKGGMIFEKQEMTRLWNDQNEQVPVTLLKLVPQEVIRKKTEEKDGYNAIVVGTGKKENKDKEKWQKVDYKYITEFKVTDEQMKEFDQGDELDLSFFESLESVSLTGYSKGKWFSGVIKKHGFSGGPESHGSHFHRGTGSIGNMKPKRVNKGHPMPGRDGNDKVTLKNVDIIDRIEDDEDELLAVKGSVPGSYGNYIKVKAK